MSILDEPLVLVGGLNVPGAGLTLFMHEGYDHLPFAPSAERLEQHLKDALTRPGDLLLIHGNHDNPLFQWPVYARAIVTTPQPERQPL